MPTTKTEPWITERSTLLAIASELLDYIDLAGARTWRSGGVNVTLRIDQIARLRAAVEREGGAAVDGGSALAAGAPSGPGAAGRSVYERFLMKMIDPTEPSAPVVADDKP